MDTFVNAQHYTFTNTRVDGTTCKPLHLRILSQYILWQFWFPGGLVYSSVMRFNFSIVYVWIGVNEMSEDHLLRVDGRNRICARVDGVLV